MSQGSHAAEREDPTPTLSTILARRHLPALDGLRALAVGIVIALHFDQSTSRSEIPGDLGVIAFFVLSGFLITWLLLEEQRQTGTVSLSKFYLRRVFRIFPAYYVFLAFSILAAPLLRIRWSAPAIVASLLYIMNYYSIAAVSYGLPWIPEGHTWSLAIEEQFYLLWAPFAKWLLSRGPRLAARVLVALILACLGWRTLTYSRWGIWVYTYKAFETRADSLAVGCLIAVWSRRDWFSRLAARLAGSPFFPLLTLALVTVLHLRTPNSYQLGPGITVDAILLGIFMVQILLLSSHTSWRWLEHPIVRYLGIISYPLYLYHRSVIRLVQRVRLPTEGKFVLVVLASIGVASTSYYLVERPFLRLKQRFEIRRTMGAGSGDRVLAAPSSRHPGIASGESRQE